MATAISKRKIRKQEKLLNQIKKHIENKDKQALRTAEKIFRNSFAPNIEKFYKNDAYYIIPQSVELDFEIKKDFQIIIDLFSGIGNFSYLFKSQNYYLIDIDEEALNIAKTINELKENNFYYIKDDLYNTTTLFDILKEASEETLIVINPPFSENFKEKTRKIINKLKEISSPIVITITDKYKIKETLPNPIKIGTARFNNTSIKTPIYAINFKEEWLKEKSKKPDKTEEEKDVDLYELYKELTSTLECLCRNFKKLEEDLPKK